MRSLASRLESKPMSLYTHIASKDELLDAVYELILASLDLPSVEGAHWREWAHDSWSAYRRALLAHPRAAIAVVRWQGARGTETSRVTDLAIGVFRAGGFSVEDALHAYRALSAFTIGMVQVEATALDRPAVERRLDGGLEHYDAALSHILRPDFDATFRTGLDAMLDGLAKLSRTTGEQKRRRRARGRE